MNNKFFSRITILLIITGCLIFSLPSIAQTRKISSKKAQPGKTLKKNPSTIDIDQQINQGKIDPNKISLARNIKTGYLKLPFQAEISKITYEVRKGLAIMEDDIVLGTVDEVERKSRINQPNFIETPNGKFIPHQRKIPRTIDTNPNSNNTDFLFSAAMNDANFLWPGGVVYYEIKHSDFPAETITEIMDAINIYNSQTNITLKSRAKEKNYILFVKTDDDVGGSSSIGMQGGKQKLYLNEDTKKVDTGVVLHELMHALGFYHEHTSANRDEFVKIKWKFIKEDKKHNFYKHTADGITFNTYNFSSIMHYSGKAFSIDEDAPTIVYKNTNNPVPGRGSSFSSLDIESLNVLYPFKKESESASSSGSVATKHGMPSLNSLRTVTTCITKLETTEGPNEKAPCNKKMDFIGTITQGEGNELIYNLAESNTKSFDKIEGNSIRPNWTLHTPLDPNKTFFRITITIKDKDDALCGGGDDFVDINARKGESSLKLWVDTFTGEVWRLKPIDLVQSEKDKLLGKVGEIITTKGGSAADHAAEMTFRIDIE